MKETKKFFENNRLNKGYSRNNNSKQSDVSFIRRKYQHVLPPIDMMEQYEELNPGSIEKLFNMAHKEQEHRHSIEMLALKKQAKDTSLGRVFALICVALISIITLSLVIIGGMVAALVFAVAAFTSIAIVSYFSSKKSTMVPMRSKYNNKPRIKNNNFSFSKKHSK